MFGDFVDRIYPIELEIKDITDIARSASYLNKRFENYNVGPLKHYDKSNDFNVHLVNFPFISSSIPGMSVSQIT